MPEDGRFEKVIHRTFGGEEYTVPLLIKNREVLDEQSKGLLMIANIIGTENVDVPETILGLISSTARIQQGIEARAMVSDDKGGGAFVIGADSTEVSSRIGGQVVMPTVLVAEFLNEWADYNRNCFRIGII